VALAELSEAQPDRVLIICPNSVKSVWVDTLDAFGYDGTLLVVNGSTKAQVERFHNGVLIINWEAIRLIPRLQAIEWDYIIADEAHNAKNRKAKRTRALKRFKAKHKRALTGTPLVNRPDELWSLLNWLYPKDFRSYWRFFEDFVDYKVIYPYGYKEVRGVKNVEKLREAISLFTLRRTKAEVLPELPEKYYTTLRVDLTKQQRKAYDEMKRDSLAWLDQQPDDQPLPAPTVLAQLTRLRQFASAYCSIEFGWTQHDHQVTMSEPSSKLDALMELLENMGDEPVVVFSQFKQLVNLAGLRLDAAGIRYNAFTGDTPERLRAKRIEEFQNGDVRVFLATIQAGGVGITLHRASTAVFLDRSWSPAMNLQAEDRLHRIGQKSAVQVISIQASQTVDQVVESALQRKALWFRKILG
jgi:SNF2 family DNA or RNA helicase